jgi:hypothetical protein
MSKQAGKYTESSNDFLAPYAPTIGTATNIPSLRNFGDGRVDITFTPDPINPATSFTVTAVEDPTKTTTAASSPITIVALNGGTTYTFKVTATNSYGTSAPSNASNSVTVTTVPGLPKNVTLLNNGQNYDIASWTAPDSDGGSSIVGYSVSDNVGNLFAVDANTLSYNFNESDNSDIFITVTAINVNGPSSNVASGHVITTPFSFAPFSPFSPFGFFGFAPFSPFSPFGFFGFAPFSPFGFFGFAPFSPFSPFGFTPYGFFSFAPFSPFSPFGFSARCVHEDTLIKTINGSKPVKSLVEGDILLTPNIDELPTSGIDGGEWNTEYWESNTLTTSSLKETKVLQIKSKQAPALIYFNNNENAKFSLQQSIFVKRNDIYEVLITGVVQEGDYLIKILEDGSMAEEKVESIHLLEQEATVYTIDVDPEDWYIAGGLLVHNLRKT